MFGLTRTDAASASLLLNLEGLATMGIAWLVFRENVDRRLLLGAFAILAGAGPAVVAGKRHLHDWGALLIAGACLCWGIDNNLTRKLSAADPVQIAMFKGLVAGTVNLLLAIAGGAHLPPAGALLAAGTVGFLGYGVSLDPVRAWPAPSRHRADRSILLARAFHRRCRWPSLLLGDTLSAKLLVAGVLMGLGSMAAPVRAT